MYLLCSVCTGMIHNQVALVFAPVFAPPNRSTEHTPSAVPISGLNSRTQGSWGFRASCKGLEPAGFWVGRLVLRGRSLNSLWLLGQLTLPTTILQCQTIVFCAVPIPRKCCMIEIAILYKTGVLFAGYFVAHTAKYRLGESGSTKHNINILIKEFEIWGLYGF
ncbi:hypothetical protein BDD12DRAFT_812237, partial [Trichophaea hybrida]